MYMNRENHLDVPAISVKILNLLLVNEKFKPNLRILILFIVPDL